jgi:hypothetical protein
MLGRLEKVELREAWNHEARDFTIWLAEEENITLLSDTIGIDIEVIKTEASVGLFNVDILAKDSNTDSLIIIENQLERTDHDHLGKIITYAAGHDAETIIWMVKDVRDEHRKAVEWLNNHLDEKINIFLIRIEIWRIGDSMPAPKFSIIESPNNWAKVIKGGPGGSRNNITETKNIQLEFWTKLKEYGEDNYSNLRYQSPRPQHWYTFSAGSSQYNILVTVSPRDKLLRAILNIKESEELYFNFANNKETIESNLGFSLNWLELPEKKSFRITIDKSVDIYDRSTWEDAQKWALEKVEKMINVFGKYK